MRGISRDSLVEFVDRKVVWVFVVVVVVSLLVVVLTGNIETNLQIGSSGGLEMDDLNEAMGNPALKGFSAFMSVMIFLAVMAGAGLIPKMFDKGRAEFYLSKPLSRPSLLLNKLFGIWTVYSGAVLISGGLVYACLGLVHGITDPSIVVLMLLSLVTLFIWMTITCFFGLLSGSTGVAIMAAFLFWVVEGVFGFREAFKELLQSRIVDIVLDVIYYLLPKVSATSDAFLIIAAGGEVSDWTPVWTTFLFALAMVIGSVWLIKKKDF